jgi:ATP-binding cassette subfamily B protein
MTRVVEKAKDFKGTLRRLVEYLAPDRMRFIVVFILAVLSTVFSIVGPKILGKATTKLGEGILARYAYIGQLNAAIENHAPPAVINNLRHQIIPGFDFNYIGKILVLMIVLYLASAAFA